MGKNNWRKFDEGKCFHQWTKCILINDWSLDSKWNAKYAFRRYFRTSSVSLIWLWHTGPITIYWQACCITYYWIVILVKSNSFNFDIWNCQPNCYWSNLDFLGEHLYRRYRSLDLPYSLPHSRRISASYQCYLRQHRFLSTLHHDDRKRLCFMEFINDVSLLYFKALRKHDSNQDDVPIVWIRALGDAMQQSIWLPDFWNHFLGDWISIKSKCMDLPHLD